MMNIIKKTLVFVVLVSLVLVGNAYAFPLTGQTLSGQADWGLMSPAQAVVGAGIEFRVEDAFGFPSVWFTVDFSEAGLVIVASQGLFRGPESLMAFYDTFGTIDEVVGLTLISTDGVDGITQANLTFDPDSIQFDVGSAANWDLAGGRFTAQRDKTRG